MQENDLNFCYSLKLIDLVQSFAYLTSWLGRLSEDFSLKILNMFGTSTERVFIICAQELLLAFHIKILLLAFSYIYCHFTEVLRETHLLQ